MGQSLNFKWKHTKNPRMKIVSTTRFHAHASNAWKNVCLPDSRRDTITQAVRFQHFFPSLLRKNPVELLSGKDISLTSTQSMETLA